jgi:hypothetical protein
MHLSADGWRETMVGTLGFYDVDGERLHTINLGATPESGKATFLERLTREVDRAQAELPGARSVGIADGAKGNWEFLEHHTEVQVVDFWHATEDLGAAAVLFRGQGPARKAWLDEMCHVLKQEPAGADQVTRDLRSKARVRPWAKASEEVTAALRYFENQNAAGRMNYSVAGGGERSDRLGGDGGGMQGDCQVPPPEGGGLPVASTGLRVPASTTPT